MITDFVAWDLETELFDRGRLAPPVVCLSTCDQSLEPKLYHWTEAEPVLAEFLKHRNMVLHNGSYDMACVAAQWPHLLPLIFQAYFEGRVVDTLLCERLVHIARGCLDGYYDRNGVFHKYLYNLKSLAERYDLGILDKDTYRTSYGLVRDVPVSRWHERAPVGVDPQAWSLGMQTYAKEDARVTYQVLAKQSFYEDFLVDAPAQARAAFALHLMSVHGMVTDPVACDAFIEQTQKDIDNARALLEAHGLVRPDGSKDTKAAKAYMERVCNEIGTPVPMTKPTKDRSPSWKPSVSLNADSTRETGDDVMMAYSLYTSSNTALERASLLKEGSYGLPLQTSFVSLVETGRISSRAPMKPLVGDNFTNLPKKAGLRECFVPRPGFVYCSIDLNSAELHAVAQVQIWAFGESTLAEALNDKMDVHSMLGAEMLGISYEDFLAEKKGKYALQRDWSKAGNFTFWGGGGVPKFVASTNAKIEKREHKLDLATGQRVKTSWKNAWYPQSEQYFHWTKGMMGEGLATIKQFVSGRVRANLDYCTTANTFFQGLVADAVKASLLPLAYECYCVRTSPLFGSRPVLSIHDELFLELREDRAHDAAFRARDILVNTCNERYMPDCKVSAEPALARRWYKKMDQVFDKNGQLVCWEPEPKKAG